MIGKARKELVVWSGWVSQGKGEGGEATKKEADGFFIRCLFCLLPWLIGAP